MLWLLSMLCDRSDLIDKKLREEWWVEFLDLRSVRFVFQREKHELTKRTWFCSILVKMTAKAHFSKSGPFAVNLWGWFTVSILPNHDCQGNRLINMFGAPCLFFHGHVDVSSNTGALPVWELPAILSTLAKNSRPQGETRCIISMFAKRCLYFLQWWLCLKKKTICISTSLCKNVKCKKGKGSGRKSSILKHSWNRWVMVGSGMPDPQKNVTTSVLRNSVKPSIIKRWSNKDIIA